MASIERNAAWSPDESEPAIEPEDCNISAILIELGCPWIDGYKPRGNRQQLLFDVVSARVNADATFDPIALDAVQRPAVLPAGEPRPDGFEEAPAIRTGDVGSSPGKETPFFLSKGELEFLRGNPETFQLYRPFNFRKTPRLFALAGAVDSHCRLDPATFVARFS